MSKPKKLLGMFLAASPDICAGIVIAHLWLRLVTPDIVNFWHRAAVYLLGIVCALLPDVSVLIYSFILKKKLASHHRELTHYPLLILGMLAGLGIGNSWFWFAAACLAAHFIDDTTDPGGIAWLAPLSWKKFQIFATERQPLQLEDWLDRYFFRPTYKSAMVVIMFFVTIAVITSI